MSNIFSLVATQETAAKALVALPVQGERAANFGLTVLNRKVRGVKAIRSAFEKKLAGVGYPEATISALWSDVKDIAVLLDGAQD